MIKMKNFIYILIITVVSCTNPLERQAEFLLPSNNMLELTSESDIGITETRTYSISENIIVDSLRKYPINVISKTEKSLIKWHKPSQKELSDLEEFITEEHPKDEKLKKLYQDFSSGSESFLALIYDKDDKAMGQKGYSIYHWVDLYFLNLDNKEITHVNYGKF